MKLNKIYKLGLILGLPIIGLVSCTSSGDNQGYEFAPQMYVSDGYEPFTQAQSFENNPNGMTMRLPVNGTVARGQLNFIYPHANTGEGYEASSTYTPWIAATEENVSEGERLYNINCWHCHGKKGGNDGPIFKSKKMPGPSWASYSTDYIKNLPDGKMYHVITHGKGLMGPHAPMLNPDERWMVVHYLRKLSLGDAFTYATEDIVIDEMAEETADSIEVVTDNHN
jgi:mono/diheme cytochrome c family protein